MREMHQSVRNRLPVGCTPEEAIAIAEKVIRGDLIPGSTDITKMLTWGQAKKMASVLLILAEDE